MATKKSTKKNTRKRGRRYMKKAARRTIAALLMITALIVAAIPATPGRAATNIDGKDYAYVYVNTTDNYILYFNNSKQFVGFDIISSEERGGTSASGLDVTHTVIKIEAPSQKEIEIPDSFSAYSTLKPYSEDPTYFDLDDEGNVKETISCEQIGGGGSGSSDIKNVDNISSLTCHTATAINAYAFSTGGPNSTLVSFKGRNVTRIEDNAFRDCSSLDTLTLGSPLDKVGKYSFYNCTGLPVCPINDIPLSDGIGESAFEGCSGIQGNVSIAADATGALAIGLSKGCFKGCSLISSVVIQDDYTSIDDEAFSGCSNLSSMTLPAKLSTVGTDVFSGCEKLNTVTIPGGMSKMPSNIFTSCQSLADVYLDNNGTSGKNDIEFVLSPSAEEYFYYDTTENKYNVTVHGYRNKEGSTTDRTSAYKYCIQKHINYDCSGCDGGYASDYYGIDKDGELTDFYVDEWQAWMVTTDLVIPDQVGGIAVKKIPSDVLKDSANKYKDFTSIKVECDGATAEDGAFNFGSDSSLKFVDFTKANNIHLDGNSGPMFSGAPGFYVYGNIEVNPATVKYDRSTKVLEEISQDDDSATSNPYVFSEKYNYVFKGRDGETTMITMSDTKPYTLADIDGQTKSAIIQKKISLPNGVLFLDGTLADESADNYQANDSVFYGDTNLEEFSAEGLLELRDLQFGGCTSLSKVSLPNTLQNCGVLPFKGCTNLFNNGLTVNENYFKKDPTYGVILGPNGSSTEAEKGTMIYEALENDTADDKTSTEGKTYKPTYAAAIKPRAFMDNNWVGTIDTTGSSVTVIPKNCFYGAKKLLNVKLSNGTREIEEGAFWYSTANGDKTLKVYNSSGLATTYAQDSGKKALWINHGAYNTGENRHMLYGLVSGDDDAEGLAKDNLYQQYHYNDGFLQYAGKFSEKKLTDASVELTMKTDINNPIRYDEGSPVDFSNYFTLTDSEDGVHKTPLVQNSDFTMEFNPTVDWNNPSDMDKVTVTFRGAGAYSSDDQDVLVRTFAIQNSGTPTTAQKLDHVGYPASTTTTSAPRPYKPTYSFSEGADYIVYDTNGNEVLNGHYTVTPSLTSVSIDEAGQSVPFTVRGDGTNATGTIFGNFTVLAKGGDISDAYKIGLINPSKSMSGSSVDWIASGDKTNGDFYVYSAYDENTILTPGTDYDWSPKNVNTTGSHPFTVVGKGAYSGLTKEGIFTVTGGGGSSSSTSSASSSGVTPKASTISVNLILNGPDRSAVSPETYKSTNTFQYWNEGDPGIKSVVDKYGNALKAGTDYVVQSYGTVKPGLGKNTGYVQIQFKGNYADEGRQNFFYDIKKDLSKNTSDDGVKSVTIQVTEATIDSDDKIEATVTLTDSTTGTDLVKDTDYLQGSFKKTSDHHADVKITGKGDKYVGTYTYNFHMDEKKSSSSSGKSSSSSSKSSSGSSSAKGSSSSSGTGGSSSTGGSGNRNSGTTVVNRNYYGNNGGTADELEDMLRAAHIDSINGGTADGYQVNITKSDEAERSFREALIRRYGSLDNIRYFSMDIDVKDENGNDIDTTGMSVTLTLPLPRSMEQYGTNNKIATVDSNGDLEDLNEQFSTLEGRPCVTFVAPHFSPYGFYVNTADLAVGTLDNTPKTGDPIHPKWFLSFGLAALSIFLFLKRDPKSRVKPA